MGDKEIVRELLKRRGWSQQRLADAVNERYHMGWKQTNVSGILNGNITGIRADNLYKILSVLGCEIVVRDTMQGDKEFKLVMEDK